MSEAKFTPGPWYTGHMVGKDHPCNCRSIVCENMMGSICTITRDDGDNDSPSENEAIANAHLIAAAPDLYEALSDIVYLFGQGDNPDEPKEVSVARAALSKARGES